MSKKLEDLIQEFVSLRDSFRHVSNNEGTKKTTLLEFQGRFNDLKSELRPIHGIVSKEWTRRDDKAATAIKYRICLNIHEGKHPDFDKCSINQAEKFAPATKEYKDFLDQRAFWKESLVNVNDLLDDISCYLIEISTRIKTL